MTLSQFRKERFWSWIFDLDSREERYLSKHPDKLIIVPTREDWTCPQCTQALSASTKPLLDHTIYTHIQFYHAPGGKPNDDKSRRRAVFIKVMESGYVPGGWVVWLDDVKIDLYLGADAHKRATKRASEFANF